MSGVAEPMDCGDPLYATKQEIVKPDEFFFSNEVMMSDDSDDDSRDWSEDRYGQVGLSALMKDVEGEDFRQCVNNLLDVPEFYFPDLNDDQCLIWGNQLVYALIGSEYDECLFIEKAVRVFFSVPEQALVRFDLYQSRDPVRMLAVLLTHWRHYELGGQSEIYCRYAQRVPFWSERDGRKRFEGDDEIFLPIGFGAVANAQGRISEADLEFFCCADALYPGTGEVFSAYAKEQCLEVYPVPWGCYTAVSRLHVKVPLMEIGYPFNAEIRRYGTRSPLPIYEVFFFARHSHETMVNLFIPSSGFRGSAIIICQGERVLWELSGDGNVINVRFRNKPYPSRAYLVRSRLCDSWSLLDPALSERYQVHNGKTYELMKYGQVSHQRGVSAKGRTWKDEVRRVGSSLLYSSFIANIEFPDGARHEWEHPPRWSIVSDQIGHGKDKKDDIEKLPVQTIPAFLSYLHMIHVMKFSHLARVSLYQFVEMLLRRYRSVYPGGLATIQMFLIMIMLSKIQEIGHIDINKIGPEMSITLRSVGPFVPSFEGECPNFCAISPDWSGDSVQPFSLNLVMNGPLEESEDLINGLGNLRLMVQTLVMLGDPEDYVRFWLRKEAKYPCVALVKLWGPMREEEARRVDRLLKERERQKDQAVNVPSWYHDFIKGEDKMMM